MQTALNIVCTGANDDGERLFSWQCGTQDCQGSGFFADRNILSDVSGTHSIVTCGTCGERQNAQII